MKTNKFQQIFNDRKAFIAYITAGHRGLDYTEQAAKALVKGGVDILEIGIPFSDPVADGPAIQAAMTDALTKPINLTEVFTRIRHIKQSVDVPIVLFSYLNPLIAMGIDKVLTDAKMAGVDGLLVVDLPLEESTDYFAHCKQHELEPICLLSPTTDDQRISQINQHANAFLYYVCRNGTTGVKNSLPDNYPKQMSHLKSLADTPVVAGFGIGNRELAQQALDHADGFVVGSAFVKAISNGATPEELQALAESIDPR